MIDGHIEVILTLATLLIKSEIFTALMNTLDRQQITDATNTVIERYAGITENYTEFMRGGRTS